MIRNPSTVATALSALAIAGTLLVSAGNAFAAVTVTNPASANISADSSSGGSVTLPPLTLTEGAAGDIAIGNLILALPSGFMFDASSIANVAFSGTGLSGSSTAAFLDSSHAQVTVTSTSTTAGSLTVGSTAPLKVKAASGTLPATGNITLSAGTIAGLTSTSSLGTLAKVPGAANKLVFTAQPTASITAGAIFPNVTVAVQDQFGNTVTADNGRPIALSAANASSSLSGTTGVNDTAGVASFPNLSYAVSDALQLVASSSPLASATSNVITVTSNATATPTSTPPAACGLANGSLIQVQGASTVYLVINCTLRPFNSEAIFRARGKKFRDIQKIENDIFKNLGIGHPVGQGNDDDGTVIQPPAANSTTTASTTLPNISGLPDGAIVKLPGNPTVYQVSGGQLQPFTSAAIFGLHGRKFGDIQTITQAQFNQFSLGNPVTPPDGTLLKGSNHTIFVVQNGQLFGIPNMQVLGKHGWSLKSLMQLSDGDMNSLAHGGTEN